MNQTRPNIFLLEKTQNQLSKATEIKQDYKECFLHCILNHMLESNSFSLGFVSDQMTQSGLHYTWCSTLWVPQKFTFHHVCTSAAHVLSAFFPSSLHFVHAAGSCCLTPHALGSHLQNKTKLPLSYPVTLFLEEQRNENKCHDHTHTFGSSAVLLIKHQ